jgi:hypothetical protein
VVILANPSLARRTHPPDNDSACDGPQLRRLPVAGVIEFRTYKIQPGQRDQIMELLRTRLFPLHREIGIRVLGPFPSAEDEDTLVWLRAFPDADSRDTMTKALYGGSEWRDELAELILPAITEHHVALVEDTTDLWSCWPQTGT